MISAAADIIKISKDIEKKNVYWKILLSSKPLVQRINNEFL